MAKKLGLALGGGGAWSIASLGVIRALSDAGIKIDYLAGCSMGAIIGAVYASDFADGDTLAQIEALFKTLKLNRLIHFSREHPFGLSSHKKVQEHIEKVLGSANFEDLKVPLQVVATDFKSGEEVIFSKGPLLPALLASSSFTLLFSPYKYNGRLFTDGGLSNPTPVDVVRKMGADVVIGIDVTSKKHLKRLEYKPKWHHKIISKIPPLHYIVNRHLGKTFYQILDLLFSNLNKQKILQSPPDFLLTPEVTDMGQFDFAKTDKFIAEGEKVTKQIIPDLKKLLS